MATSLTRMDKGLLAQGYMGSQLMIAMDCAVIG